MTLTIIALAIALPIGSNVSLVSLVANFSNCVVLAKAIMKENYYECSHSHHHSHLCQLVKQWLPSTHTHTHIQSGRHSWRIRDRITLWSRARVSFCCEDAIAIESAFHMIESCPFSMYAIRPSKHVTPPRSRPLICK